MIVIEIAKALSLMKVKHDKQKQKALKELKMLRNRSNTLDAIECAMHKDGCELAMNQNDKEFYVLEDGECIPALEWYRNEVESEVV